MELEGNEMELELGLCPDVRPDGCEILGGIF